MSKKVLKDWITKCGLRARVIENSIHGHLCGYVGVDQDSGFFEVDYNEIENFISVHGGTTFSGFFEDLDAPDLWWIGYDCAHSCDFSNYNPKGIKRNVDYCAKECEELARQLKDTPLDYLFRSKKMDKVPDELHNKMLAWSIENPEDKIIKEYFKNIR